MIDKLVSDLEAYGLVIVDVVEIFQDTLIKTTCGVDIWIFDPALELESRIEYNDLVYFTDGDTNLAVSIVNQVEAIKIARTPI